VVEQLAEADHLDAGMLALLANVRSALAAFDTAQAEAEAAEQAAPRRLP
jgi:hypothetical protein